MRTLTRFFSLTLLLLSATLLHAQSDYSIPYQDVRVDLPENISTFSWDDLDRSDRIAGGHYLWVQFYNTPTQEIQNRLTAEGVELQYFIGNKAYQAFVPASTSLDVLAAAQVRSIAVIEGPLKLSENLRYGMIGDWAIEGNKLLVTLQHYDKVSTEQALNQLSTLGITVKKVNKGAKNIDLVIPNDCLDQLAGLSFVSWVEVIAAPPVKDDRDGRNLHRSSNLDTQMPGGRNYDGSGIGVMVRDDGFVGPHIDFQGRIDNSATDNMGPTHGDGVAGIMAGAGNLNPDFRGMAAGANVFVVQYVSDFQDFATTNLINDGSVQITNSSYSDGCNAGYTTGTQTVDQQTVDISSLLHVFSAGNSNNNDCGFGAGTQWGNITGGHKQGKNVIATANVFSDASLVGSSSRGPAYDGRIKPDIAANGQNQISTDENNEYLSFGGTSGAAPGIAGVSAQLYQAYQEMNGELPPSALIKATLLNTANDYGNVGPDFKFGWGIVNGYRAVQLLEDERYLNDTITQGEKNTHTISIPEGVTQARFMVYWRDPAALPGATRALVNDIDMVVLTEADSNMVSDTLYPWILDPTPNATTLDLPATNGVDRLNNMEQVLINEPAAGNYTLDISGFDIPLGPQEYYIVYEVITDNVVVTFPNDRINLEAGQVEFIQWDAVNTTASFNLEYSNDNGATWNTAGFAPASNRLATWTVPNDLTGEALIRVTSGDYSDVSDTTFAIAPQVTGLEVEAACPTSMSFTWDALEGAENYELYILGEQYMEIRGITSETNITIEGIPLGGDVWYAITASNDSSGWGTRRTNAQLYNEDLFNCPLQTDLQTIDILSGPDAFSALCGVDADSLVRVNIFNNGMMDMTNFEVSYQLDNDPAVTEMYTDVLMPGTSGEFVFSTPLVFEASGVYELTIVVNTEGDEYVANNDFSTSFYIATEAIAAPAMEDFESAGFPSDAWQVENADEMFGWVETNVIGANGLQTTAGFMNNFEYDTDGERDYVVSPIYAIDQGAALSFDLAKAQYGANFSDAFEVEISTDCGSTYESIYFKNGLQLSTITGYNTSFNWEPSAGSEWRTETVDLTEYAGENALFRFANINGYGNSTYLDNINVTVDTVSSVQENFTLRGVEVFPNPTSTQLNVILPANNGNVATLTMVNSIGQQVLQQATIPTSQTVLNVAGLPAGVYYLKVNIGQESSVQKVIVE